MKKEEATKNLREDFCRDNIVIKHTKDHKTINTAHKKNTKIGAELLKY
jgi:hypothetical protein